LIDALIDNLFHEKKKDVDKEKKRFFHFSNRYHSNVNEIKTFAKPNLGSPSESTILKENKIQDSHLKIESDQRFEKSTEEGVLYIAKSFSFITDEVLREYGITKWTRYKEDIENIVLVLQIENKPQVSHHPSYRLG